MHKQRRRQRWWRSAATLCAAATVLASCGSDAPVAAVATEPTGVATSTPQPKPTPQPEPTPEPEPTPTSVVTIVALESVYDAPTAGAGWPVPAGHWSSSSFSTPVRFDVPAEATLLADGLGRLEFAIGPPDEPEGWIYIVEPAALNRPTGPVPIDLIDPDKAFDGATILSEATVTGSLGEFSITDFRPDSQPVLEQFTRPCFRRPGRRCIAPYATASGPNPVVFTMDGVHRVAGVDFAEEGRLNVIAFAADDTNTAFLDHVDVIASSLATTDATWTGTAALDTLGWRGDTLPQGRWVRSIGSTLMTLDVEQDLAVDPVFFPELDVVGIEAGEGAMFLVHLDVRYDLESGGLPADADPWTPPAADDVADAVALATDTFEFVDTTFAGLPAIELTNIVYSSAAACPGLAVPVAPGKLCASWFRSTSSTFYGYKNEDGTVDEDESLSRLLYIEDLGLIVSVTDEADDPVTTALLAEFEAALTLAPIG